MKLHVLDSQVTHFHAAITGRGRGAFSTRSTRSVRSTRLTRSPGAATLGAAAFVTVLATMFAVPAGVFAQGSALFAVGESAGGAGAGKQSTAKQSTAKPATAKPATALPSATKASTMKSSSATASPVRARGDVSSVKAGSRKTAAKGKSTRGKTALRPSPIAIDGRWHDSQCIPLTGVTHKPPLYVKRQYEFNDLSKSWRIDAVVYASDDCLLDTRLLTYRGDGSFLVTGRSSVAASAFEASFRIDRWSASPESREAVLILLNGRCGSGDFEVGQALDLSATGCPTLGIRSIEQAPREVELVSVSNGKFYLGSRSFVPGLKDDRPAQLSSYGLVRIP